MDHCGSGYCTNKVVNRILDQAGSKGKEHKNIVSLRFSIVQYLKGIYKKGFLRQVRGFVSMYDLVEQSIPNKEVV